jgi:hypothetical protein
MAVCNYLIMYFFVKEGDVLHAYHHPGQHLFSANGGVDQRDFWRDLNISGINGNPYPSSF